GWTWGTGHTALSKFGKANIGFSKKKSLGSSSQLPTAVMTPGGGTYSLRLAGAVDSIKAGAQLVLFRRDKPSDAPLLATVQTATIAPAAAGGKETRLTVALLETPPDDLTAANAKLARASQSASLWSLNSAP